MRKPLKNVGASVRTRLLNLSKERNEPYDLLLTQYALERLLYRLSISKYKEQFALKGAMLLRYRLQDPHRPTREVDLPGFGEPGGAVGGSVAVGADDRRLMRLLQTIIAGTRHATSGSSTGF